MAKIINKGLAKANSKMLSQTSLIAPVTIGKKYVAILENIIEKNSLTDFDKANLLPTKLKKDIAL